MSGPLPGASPAENGDDPTMEDILASIRRILNDDGEAAGAAPDGETTPSHAAPATDVFELDHAMIIDEEPSGAELQPVNEAEPAPEAPAHHTDLPEDDRLLAPATEAAASASMGALVRVLGQRQTPVYRGGPTLEDIVRDEIRPLVKNWLDENLPQMVERMVRAEIERVTRSGL